jgi:CRP-like cAMP-binding protein
MRADDPMTGVNRVLDEGLRSVFPHALAASRDRLADVAIRRDVGPGFLDGARSSEPEIMLVLEGHVAVVQRAPDGRVAILGLFGPGGLIGLATIDGVPQAIALEALDAVVLAAWPSLMVREVAERDPGMLLDVVDQLVTRVRGAMFLLERQTFATSSMRLASALLRNEALVFSMEQPRVARSQVAAFAGVSREMAGRILRRWERAGIIRRVGQSGLVLVDRQSLEGEAAGAESLAPRTGLPVEMS